MFTLHFEIKSHWIDFYIFKYLKKNKIIFAFVSKKKYNQGLDLRIRNICGKHNQNPLHLSLGHCPHANCTDRSTEFFPRKTEKHWDFAYGE